MRVLLLMDPFIKVPPDHYGGIERVVADLAARLTLRGHDVTLWAAPGSRVDGRVETFGREGEWTRWSNVRNTLTLAGRFLRRPRRFDIIHNFGRLAYLTPMFARDVAKVQTYMRTVDPANMATARRLGARRLHYTAVSAAIADTGRPGGGDWSVIYNCAVPARYQFSAATDARTAPLVFLGRLDRIKGVHHAITVAQRLQRRLIIAGNISPLAHEQAYFDDEIKSRIDGERVSYIGPVGDAAKQALLGGAAAMLLEQMRARRGGVPEGIDHGRTGFLCDTVEEMTALVARLPEIDRRAVRAEAERRFSDTAIAAEYEGLYQRLLAASPRLARSAS